MLQSGGTVRSSLLQSAEHVDRVNKRKLHNARSRFRPFRIQGEPLTNENRGPGYDVLGQCHLPNFRWPEAS